MPKNHQLNNEPPVTLSVIVPFYNEAEVLPECHERLTKVLESLPERCEIVYVDDGSSDNSRQIAQSLSSESCLVRCVGLSRNFGKESAMSAGLEYCRGLAVVLIDADLQDPPELIPQMLEKWREGYDVVNMQRKNRDGETWMKKFTAASFYRVMNFFSNMNIPENVGDFRLLSREVVDHINQLPEKNRYMKGVFTWPGFKQATIQFDRDARHSGETKWNYLKLIGLAVDGITSFSIRPLRIATVLGTLIALSSFIYGGVIVAQTLLYGSNPDGYPSLMVVQLAIGGIQLLTIGVLGEYIGRIFTEVKGRPIYLIQEVTDVVPQDAKRQRVINRFAQVNQTSSIYPVKMKESA